MSRAAFLVYSNHALRGSPPPSVPQHLHIDDVTHLSGANEGDVEGQARRLLFLEPGRRRSAGEGGAGTGDRTANARGEGGA